MTLLFNPNVIGAGLNAGYAADQDIQVLTEKMRQREEARFLREYNTYNDLVAKDRYNKAINDGLGPQKAAQAMAGAGYAGLAPGIKASNDLANSAAAGYENSRAVEGQAAEQDGIFSPFRKGDRPGTIARGEYYGGNGTIMEDRRYDARLEANKTEAERIRAEAMRIRNDAATRAGLAQLPYTQGVLQEQAGMTPFSPYNGAVPFDVAPFSIDPLVPAEPNWSENYRDIFNPENLSPTLRGLKGARASGTPPLVPDVSNLPFYKAPQKPYKYDFTSK